MNTNMMELNLNEMELVNGGEQDPDYKIKAVGTMTATGAAMGAMTGAGLGNMVVPVVGALVGGAIGTIVGAAIGGGSLAIGYLFTED